MASTMEVLVATVEREVYHGRASFLAAPSVDGELGILPRHAPLLAQLRPGELRITTESGEVDEVFIKGGFLEVQPDRVFVLADAAERATDIDEAEAAEAERRAREMLEKRTGDVDLARVEAEIAWLAARLAWLRKKKKQ